jgi:hypothetical protein
MMAGTVAPTARQQGQRSRARHERWLARVWQRQAFDRANLRTSHGLAIKVVYPGRWTGEAGPDFHDAILALPDGRLLRGDVELHLESAGWLQHGHHLDPAYDRVVLHVVLQAGEPVRNSQGELVPTLELSPRLGSRGRASAAAEPEPGEQLSYVVQPCRNVLPAMDAAELTSRLQSLALERFEAKQAIFEGELASAEPEQALHVGLMEALGYSRNKQPFRELAQRVPVGALRCQGSVLELERLLLAGAGLLGGAETTALLAGAGLIPAPLPRAAWQRLGVRPGNLPDQRIRQFAAILGRLLPNGLLDELLGPLAEFGGSPGAGALLVRCRREWRRQLAEVGPQRADAMVINVLLPFAAAYGQASCQFWLSEVAAQAFLAHPAQGANQATSYMRSQILGPSLAGYPRGAAGEQALMQVWERWCRDKVCALCPLGRKNTEQRRKSTA